MTTSMPMKVNEMRDRNAIEGVSVELGKYKDLMSKYLECMIRGVVNGLSDEYNFDEKEALTKLGLGLGLKGRRVRKIKQSIVFSIN